MKFFSLKINSLTLRVSWLCILGSFIITTNFFSAGCSTKSTFASKSFTTTIPTIPPPAAGQTPTFLGIFSQLTLSKLPIIEQKRAKVQIHTPFMGDSYDSNLVLKPAASSMVYLVFVFPPSTQGIRLYSSQINLAISGNPNPVGICAYCLSYSPPNTNGFQSNVNNAFVFSDIITEVSMGKPSRLAVVFEVPASGGSGVFTINGVSNTVQW